MDIASAYHRVRESLACDVGRFYGPPSGPAIGKGGILKDAIYAAYDDESGRFATVLGMVYVLTHECDIDPANDRGFNTDMLVCPDIRLEDLVAVL